MKFQDLSFLDLKDVIAWLEKNVPSYNYAIISDFHSVLEHVNHQVNPTKVTLDSLESIRKLEIPTPNHVIMIQSFDAHLPKFLCKNKSHHVTKSDESMFDNIKTYSEWDEPNYGYCQRLTEEANNA